MSEEMNMRKVIEILTRYSKMISEIDGDCFSPDAIREINLIFLGQQFLKSLPTLKPSGRTVQEIREYCKKEVSRLETQMDDPIKRRFLGNLVQQDGAEWHGVKGVLDFIDSGEEKEASE